MANQMNTEQVANLLKEASKLAKDTFKSTDPIVVVGIAQLLSANQRREKKVLPAAGFPSRPDPVQEARKTPRKPFAARSSSPAAKKKTARKR